MKIFPFCNSSDTKDASHSLGPFLSRKNKVHPLPQALSKTQINDLNSDLIDHIALFVDDLSSFALVNKESHRAVKRVYIEILNRHAQHPAISQFMPTSRAFNIEPPPYIMRDAYLAVQQAQNVFVAPIKGKKSFFPKKIFCFPIKKKVTYKIFHSHLLHQQKQAEFINRTTEKLIIIWNRFATREPQIDQSHLYRKKLKNRQPKPQQA